jgi:hypothetical protein
MSEATLVCNNTKLQRSRRADPKFDDLADREHAIGFIVRASEVAMKTNDQLRRIENFGDLRFNDVANFESINKELHGLDV